MEIRCPDCGKILTPADSKEPCPKSLYQHALHPIVVMDLSKVPAEFYAQKIS